MCIILLGLNVSRFSAVFSRRHDLLGIKQVEKSRNVQPIVPYKVGITRNVCQFVYFPHNVSSVKNNNVKGEEAF